MLVAVLWAMLIDVQGCRKDLLQMTRLTNTVKLGYPKAVL